MVELIHNPGWDEFKHLIKRSSEVWLTDVSKSPDDWIGLKSLRAREAFILKYAWSMPAPATVDFIISHLKEPRKLIEIGAGLGYWASIFEQHGVPVTCYDDLSWKSSQGDRWHSIKVGGPKWAALYPEHTLFLCWPPYGESMAMDALNAYKGNQLVYIGEGESGCTGNDEFHAMLDKEWVETAYRSNPAFYGINDRVFIYERKNNTAKGD